MLCSWLVVRQRLGKAVAHRASLAGESRLFGIDDDAVIAPAVLSPRSAIM
jgi:hypothetical protein